MASATFDHRGPSLTIYRCGNRGYGGPTVEKGDGRPLGGRERSACRPCKANRTTRDVRHIGPRRLERSPKQALDRLGQTAGARVGGLEPVGRRPKPRVPRLALRRGLRGSSLGGLRLPHWTALFLWCAYRSDEFSRGAWCLWRRSMVKLLSCCQRAR